MAIVPDDKDWTWVLERACPECGFDAGGFPREQVGDLIDVNVAEWVALAGEGVERLGERPSADRWSGLEYACHVRDVLDVQRGRVERALVEDRPEYVPMGRDQRVVDDRYNEQDPRAVTDQLAANAEAIAATFEALTPEQWARVGVYQYPAPTERDMVWLGRHTVHEGHHHLLDVGRSLRGARGR